MAKIDELTILEENEDTQKGRYLTFALNNELYGIEIKYVTEIIGLQPITTVPELPDFICGIINLRGKIITVMDVRLRFNKAYRAYDDRTCVIVIDIMNYTTGLIIDRVEEVLSIPDSEIVVPAESKITSNKYIKGIGKVGNEVRLILDCNKLLNIEEIDLTK